MKLNWYSKILILALVIIGFLVWSVPSVLSEPNFQGVPTIPIAVFVFAFAFYLFILDHRKLLYATIIILLIIFGYTGFWAYNYKMPLSSLETSIEIYHLYLWPPSSFHSSNTSEIQFNLTIRNPTNIDTPPFNIESAFAYVNNARLKGGYDIEWHSAFAIDEGHYGYYEPCIIIKANDNLTIRGLSVVIYEDSLEAENGDTQDIWASLVGRNFALGISGTFASRPNFEVGDTSRQSLWILAETRFMVSQSFSESNV